MAELSKKDLFEAIKHGHAWHMQRIKEELEKIIASSPISYCEIDWDVDDKFYYLYDAECYLFFEDGLVTTRSDKDNVANTGLTVNHPINSFDDLQVAFKYFIALTLEGEE